VQIAVTGDAARAFGELARDRWQRATGHAVAPPPRFAPLWPRGLIADLEQVDVAISRTEPGHEGRAPVREVERLHLDAIAAAEHTLYVENPYFTSTVLCRALAASLAAPSGPEVILVLPGKTRGLFEHETMDVMRDASLRRLRASDPHGRLHVYAPMVTAGGVQAPVTVHSKVVIADDRLLRVGSSNFSNRSMGFDTECDVVLEAGEPRIARAIAALRNRLLGEHLGVPPELVAATCSGRTLSEAIELMRGGEHSLEPLPIGSAGWKERLVAGAPLFDLGAPVIDPEELLGDRAPLATDRRPALARLALFVVLLIVLAASWRWSPASMWLEQAGLARWLEIVRDAWWGPAAALATYVAGGLVMFPVTLLILQTGATFGPFLGAVYALAGAVTSASVGYWLGRLIGRDALEKLASKRVQAVSRRLAEHGTTAVVAVRVIPVAPFSLINLVAGASHIRFADFLKGTLIGMGPGVLAMSVIGDRLGAVLRDPAAASIALLALAAAALLLAAWILMRRFG
jgi:phospholipase D1/2